MPELIQHARKALRAAGSRALVLHAYAAAARAFEAAADLRLEPDPDRPRALLRYGAALVALLDSRRFDVLEEARSAFIAVEDRDGAAEADLALAEAWWWAGRRDRCASSLERAAEIVARGEPSIITAAVLAQIARFHALFGEDDAAVESARESLRLAEQFSHEELRAKNLITLGSAEFFGQDSEREAALENVRAGIAVAAACGDLMQLSRGYVNLSSLLQQAGALREAEAALLEAADLAERRVNAPAMRFAEGNMIELDTTFGRWETVERRVDEFLEASGDAGHYMDNIAVMWRSLIRLARDESALARADTERSIAAGRKLKDPQALVPALGIAAMVYAELGEADRARDLLEELQPGAYIAATPAAFFAASRVGVAEEFRERVREFRRSTPWDQAADAVLDGRWVEAADTFDEIGARPFAALAALRAAEAFLAQGRRAEADQNLSRALEFWRSVSAKRYVREGEALLAASA